MPDQAPPGAIISSGNAYLLVYCLRGWQPPANQQQLLGVGSSMEHLPEELQAALQQLRTEYEAQVKGHADMQAEAAARVTARQQVCGGGVGGCGLIVCGCGQGGECVCCGCVLLWCRVGPVRRFSMCVGM
jgi:hypothetical protein